MAKIIWTATCASIVSVAAAALIAQAAPSQQTPSAQQTSKAMEYRRRTTIADPVLREQVSATGVRALMRSITFVNRS